MQNMQINFKTLIFSTDNCTSRRQLTEKICCTYDSLFYSWFAGLLGVSCIDAQKQS